MKGQSLLLLGAGILFGATGAYAQHPEGGHPEGQSSEPQQGLRNEVPRANQGRIPPAPAHRDEAHGKPEVDRHANGKVNETQHVSNDHWYGHNRPDDKRYHLDRPYEHGRSNISEQPTGIASNDLTGTITASGFRVDSTRRRQLLPATPTLTGRNRSEWSWIT